MATPTFEPSAEALSYEEHRIELVHARLRNASLAVLALTLIFETVAYLMVPEQWWAEVGSNLFLLLVPLLAMLTERTALVTYPQLLFLLFDLVYSITVLLRFFMMSAFISGIEAFTIIKLMGTAVLIPWSPAMQIVSAFLTLTLYWSLFYLSGRMPSSNGDLPHQLTSPFFGALLSIVGVVGADRLRRKLFLQRRTAEREALTSSHFAATMSHELRNLLSAIQGYGEMLADEPQMIDGLRQEIANRLQSLAAQGLDVINTTLEISRSDRNHLALRIQTVDLRLLLDELNEETQRRGVPPSVNLSWQADRIELSTDPLKLKMILRNLVGNALKFTASGDVVVRARASDTVVVIEVADTGPGIAPKEVPQIFEAFGQAEAGRLEDGGTGLGLYVVKRLVTALGGRIEVESRLGSGSTFRVSLPRVTRLTA